METVDTSWLTEAYLNDLGYYKIKDDGQYGVYRSEHLIAESLTYGKLPKDYRKVSFNRDKSIGVFLSVQSDWDTRYSIRNACATTREVFEILLNASV